jgi:hypothetical protein
VPQGRTTQKDNVASANSNEDAHVRENKNTVFKGTPGIQTVPSRMKGLVVEVDTVWHLIKMYCQTGPSGRICTKKPTVWLRAHLVPQKPMRLREIVVQPLGNGIHDV